MACGTAVEQFHATQLFLVDLLSGTIGEPLIIGGNVGHGSAVTRGWGRLQRWLGNGSVGLVSTNVTMPVSTTTKAKTLAIATV